MKTKTILMMMIALFLMVGETGCEKEEYPDYVEGYIVASFVGDKIGEDGIATGETPRGFCILLENSKNENSHYPMDFYTFNLPENLFHFLEEIITGGCNGNDCGPVFFPEDLRRVYKIKFNYKVLGEKKKFICGCTTMLIPFPWEKYSEVSLKNTVKLKK